MSGSALMSGLSLEYKHENSFREHAIQFPTIADKNNTCAFQQLLFPVRGYLAILEISSQKMCIDDSEILEEILMIYETVTWPNGLTE